ncbi:MAG: hypothetical protein U1E25_04580 [Methylocystis sp.]
MPSARGGSTRIELIAYNPEDILRAIAASAFGFTGYVSTFRLEIENDGATERFIGLPEWDGSPPDFDKVMAEHFRATASAISSHVISARTGR